ncbi:hypothetical protein M422DRAFT_263929 [Sphaerobolus stellatus SS14]|uniref:SIS domain-containing protein n=1 Tax=Sphaerobolus stellatus (strain SS14) TaxID=990650 RepID=A0A0C9TUF0_SPHS4|nr:hypothetical protein M422DRAFT_263929 [Sphaerobolus stellatus SS14]
MKGKFKHFMLKEIHEQPDSVVNTMRGRVNLDVDTVNFGGLKAYLLPSVVGAVPYLAKIPASVELASDFLDRKTPIFRDGVFVFVFQSGETADTILALRYCLERGALCLGVVSMVGSTISRETHCVVRTNAGPEVGVASTKAYTSQYIALLIMVLQLCEDRLSLRGRRRAIIEGLRHLPEQIQTILNLDNELQELAKTMLSSKSLLIMGHGFQYAIYLEGALKIKEIAYMHSEGILAGELNTVPSQGIPLLNVQFAFTQITAHKAKPIIICNDNDTSVPASAMSIRVSKTVDYLQGIINVIPLQLLSYHLAVITGFDFDFPRNLAKSATTE